MKNKSITEMNPEDLVKAYIKSKGKDISIIPKHAVDRAIGEIEELLIFLDIDPYPDESDNVKLLT